MTIVSFSLTSHCIAEDFNQSCVVLRVKPFPTSHSASNISDVMEEYEVPSYKVHVIVHDNAANMNRAVANTGFNSLNCFLHTTQLVIDDAIFEQRMIEDIIANSRQIARHFNHSTLAYTKLEELQIQHSLPEHKLIQDVTT